MFPQMRTSSTPNNKHPTPKRKTYSLGCALHQHLTINTQHPNANMFPRMRTSSTPNNKHPTPKRKPYSLGCALHQHPTFNTQHPTQAPDTLPGNNLHRSASTKG